MRLCTLLLLTTLSWSQGYEEVATDGHLVQPARVAFSEATLQQLKLPQGFRISVFARDLEGPRMMAVGLDGTVYVTRPDKNDLLMLRDGDGDGRAEFMRVAVKDLEMLHGIALQNDKLYLADVRNVYEADLDSSGAPGTPRRILGNLPDGGQHWKRTLGIGPDGLLYVNIGSSCNNCTETNPEHATILQFKPDGSGRAVFARGLRNTGGFDWHPINNQLWGMDHGSDWRGDNLPPEELNLIAKGSNYGWPFCFGARQVDRWQPGAPQGSTKEQFCSETEPSVLNYQAHSAPIDFKFYRSLQFPAEYRNSAFVTMRGSWNRKPATGFKVVKVSFQNGQPQQIEDFLTGFLSEDGRSYFGRVAGLAIARDGSLLVSDDTSGVIYRVTYTRP